MIDKLQACAQDITGWCRNNQMEANPSKFQVLISEEKEATTIQIDNCSINSEPHVKLLGVYLDNQLNFHQHITELTKKAGRQLNCLKRVAYPLSEDIRLLLYKSFVLSNFDYCRIVWHHCGIGNCKKLEKI